MPHPPITPALRIHPRSALSSSSRFVVMNGTRACGSKSSSHLANQHHQKYSSAPPLVLCQITRLPAVFTCPGPLSRRGIDGREVPSLPAIDDEVADQIQQAHLSNICASGLSSSTLSRALTWWRFYLCALPPRRKLLRGAGGSVSANPAESLPASTNCTVLKIPG